MKKITIGFLFIFSVIYSTTTIAQTRYLDPLFTVDTTNHITYGVNFSVMLHDTLPIPTGMTIPVGVDSATGTPIYFTMPALEFDILSLQVTP